MISLEIMFTMLCFNTNLKHGIVIGKSTKSRTMKPLREFTQ
jgi:hypothetical protein